MSKVCVQWSPLKNLGTFLTQANVLFSSKTSSLAAQVSPINEVPLYVPYSGHAKKYILFWGLSGIIRRSQEKCYSQASEERKLFGKRKCSFCPHTLLSALPFSVNDLGTT